MKKIMSLLMLVILSFSLSSCKWMKESLENTKYTLETFLSYLKEKDYTSASNLLHDESELNKPSLEENISEIEKNKNIDFSLGTELKTNQSFQITGYTSEYNGSTYEATYGAIVGNIECEIYIFILDNEKDNGIYKFVVMI